MEISFGLSMTTLFITSLLKSVIYTRHMDMTINTMDRRPEIRKPGVLINQNPPCLAGSFLKNDSGYQDHISIGSKFACPHNGAGRPSPGFELGVGHKLESNAG